MFNQSIEDNYIKRYYAEIKSGKILAGHDMKTLLKMLIEDMESGEYQMDFKAADIRIDFIESCCKLTKAEFYGKPFILELWEKAFITAIYSFQMYLITGIDDTGKELYGWVRRFTEALLLIARKNGKTEVMASMAIADLVLAGQGMDICCGSNDDEQSKILFTAVGSMKEQMDPHENYISQTQKIIRCTNKNTLFRMSEKMRNIEGRLLARAYIDEACMMSAEAKIARAAIQSTSVLNDPLIIYLTSEGFIDEGFLDSLTSRGQKILKKENDDDKRFLPWMYTGDETESQIFSALDTPGGWRIFQKTNPNIGNIKKISYLQQELEKAKEDRAHRIWVMNKDFSMKQSSATAFLDLEHYGYKQETWSLEDFRDCIAIGGIDMAETTDLNALSLIFLKRDEAGQIGKTFYVHNQFFIPLIKLEKSDDNFNYQDYPDSVRVVDGLDIDTKIIADYLFELYQQYGIIPMITGYDLKFANNFKTAMDGYGFKHEVILQTPDIMNNPIRYAEQLFRHQYINYNNNPVMRFCIGNSSLHLDNKGKALIVKKNNDRRNRIDGLVSFIIALEAYNRNREEYHQYVRYVKGGM